MKCPLGLLFACFGLLPFVNQGVLKAQSPTPQQLAFFEKKIRPVLVEHCYSCHSKNAKNVKGGLILDTREGIRMGGDSGHAVVPGEIENSLLIEAIRYESMEMPPKQQLPEAVIKDFEKWIRMGAPDPREGPKLIKRTIDFAEAKQHWAFQPIQTPTIPQPQNESWAKHAIDRFVLAKLEDKSLRPAADATRTTLVRRLYFDLVGLPPTAQQLQDFLNDQSSDALERLVDRLLASPQFGERWGRYWLDVVRYAESNGRERNFVYPHAWRYRDYVIDSFNQDKSYADFVREQLAGDLQEDPSDEQLIATGFLAIGPKLLNEGNRNKFQMDLVDDQVDVTTRAFMGLTVSCARCHDHKFDPIPTKEYYSLAGIFRSTETMFGTNKQQGNRQASRLISLGTDPTKQKQLQQQHDNKVKQLAESITSTKNRIASLRQGIKTRSRNKDLNAKIKKQRTNEDNRKIANLRSRIKQLQQQHKRMQGVQVGEVAMGVREGKVADSPIYIRGEVSSPKGVAPRGFLTILDDDLQQPQLDTNESGRRELVDWILDDKNPLTNRVVVNRIWQHLFGVGLVKTVDNFGATGEPPTHPELLDYLANEFDRQGGRFKPFIRTLVLTRTYGLSSSYDEANYAVDPGNRYYWRHSPRRVDAEALRDAILHASQSLKLDPPLGSPVSTLQGEYGRQVLVEQLIQDHQHRSVYLPIIRNDVPEPLKLFDFAEPSILVGERAVTTVPTQALYFLNSDFVTKQCDQFAEKLLEESQSDYVAKINHIYHSILARPPSNDEITRAGEFVTMLQNELSSDQEKDSRVLAWSGLIQAVFGSAEFRYID